MTYSSHGGSWSFGLTLEQWTTVREIRRATERGDRSRTDFGSYGWSIFRTPSTINPPHYLELRHYINGGPVARWVIEQDGTVSAWNEQGQTRDRLVPFTRSAA